MKNNLNKCRTLFLIVMLSMYVFSCVEKTSSGSGKSEKLQTAQKLKEVKYLVEKMVSTHDLPMHEIMPKVKEAVKHFKKGRYHESQIILDALTKELREFEKVDYREIPVQNQMDVSKINTNGWQDTPFISTDGDKLHFTYSPHDYMGAIKTKFKKIIIRGPIRPGHTREEYITKPQVLVTHNYVSVRKTADSWSEPKPIHFEEGDRVGGSLWVSEDGNTMYLAGWGKRNRTNYGSGDIYVSTRKSGNKWTKPANLGSNVNTKYLEDNPHFSEDENRLYFDSDRPKGHGRWDIYYTTKDDDGNYWTEPVNIGPPVNTRAVEGMAYLSANGKRLYFTRGDPDKFKPTQIYVAEKLQDGNFSEPVLIDLGMTSVSSPSVTRDEKELYFLCEKYQSREMAIWFSRKKADGTWGKPELID